MYLTLSIPTHISGGSKISQMEDANSQGEGASIWPKLHENTRNWKERNCQIFLKLNLLSYALGFGILNSLELSFKLPKYPGGQILPEGLDEPPW